MNRKHAYGALVATVLLVLAASPAMAQEEAAGSEESYLGWGLEGDLVLRGWGVSGDDQAFKQYHQVNDGVSGGLRPFEFSYKREDGLLLWGESVIDAPNDYRLEARLQKEGGGWARLELDRERYYYDGQFLGAEGYPSVGAPVLAGFRQDVGDLETWDTHLLMEVGLAFENFPKVWLGYERGDQNGEKSTWVHGITVDPGNFYEFGAIPQYWQVNNESHRIYAGLSIDLGKGWNWDVLPEYEMVRSDQKLTDFFFDRFTALRNTRFKKYIQDHDMATLNTVFRGPLSTDKLDLEVGYHYHKIWNENNAEATASPGVRGILDEKALHFLNNEHRSDAYMHRFFTELTWHAHEKVTAWLGFQYRNGLADNDSTRVEDGSAEFDANGPTAADETWYFDTENFERGWAESLGIEVRAIERTKIVVRLELEQIDVDYDWDANIVYDPAVAANPLTPAAIAADAAGDAGDWAWDDEGSYLKYTPSVDIHNDCADWLESHLRYKYTLRDANHDEDLDFAELKPADPDFTVTPAAFLPFFYPGTVEDTSRETHEVSWQLAIDPADWVTVRPRTGFTHTTNEVDNQTVSERIALTQSWLYGINVELRPCEGLTAATDAYWRNGHTWTEASRYTRSLRQNPQTLAPDAGYFGALTGPQSHDFTSISELVQYQVNRWTFNLFYAFTREESQWRGHRHFGSIGAIYEISEHVTIDVTGGYEDYSEDQNGDVNEYDAWMGVLGVKAKF